MPDPDSRVAPADAGAPALEGARVALVNMPFAGFRQPSPALGLLAAVLRERGADVTVLEATLTFAEGLTPTLYDAIAGWQAHDLLGDWVFAPLHAHAPLTGLDEYAREVLGGGAKAHDVPHFGKPPLTQALRAGLEQARARAAGLLDDCLRELVALRPQVVGFTIMFGQLAASLALAERVKRALPEALVVFGGAGCRGEMGGELRRRFPAVEAVVDGEGEAALPEIVRARLAGEPVNPEGDEVGIVPKPVNPVGDGAGAAPIDLNALPSPDFSDYFARLALSPLAGTFAPRVPVEASRGCWWGEKRRCTFCGQASAALAYRQKSPARVLAELEQFQHAHPGCPVFFTDEIAPRDAFKDLVPELPKRVPGLEVVYFETRPDLTREQLHALSAAGITRVEAGIESLSTPTLRLMRKGTTALQGIQFLKWTREEGLRVVWNLLWGIPGEDPAEYARMAELVPLLTHLQPPNTVGDVRLDRFAPMCEDPAAFGLRDVHAVPAYRHVFDLPQESLDRLAYFFTFSADKPEPVAAYTEALAAEVMVWKESFPGGGLRYADDGETLTIDDARLAFFTEDYAVLTGAHRALYLAADGVAPAEALARAAAEAAGRALAEGELEELLRPLLDQGLMLRDGDRYLSLAVRAARRPAS